MKVTLWMALENWAIAELSNGEKKTATLSFVIVYVCVWECSLNWIYTVHSVFTHSLFPVLKQKVSWIIELKQIGRVFFSDRKKRVLYGLSSFVYMIFRFPIDGAVCWVMLYGRARVFFFVVRFFSSKCVRVCLCVSGENVVAWKFMAQNKQSRKGWKEHTNWTEISRITQLNQISTHLVVIILNLLI